MYSLLLQIQPLDMMSTLISITHLHEQRESVDIPFSTVVVKHRDFRSEMKSGVQLRERKLFRKILLKLELGLPMCTKST